MTDDIPDPRRGLRRPPALGARSAVAAVLAAAMLAPAACGAAPLDGESSSGPGDPSAAQASSAEPDGEAGADPGEDAEDGVFTILATGDVLPHGNVLKTADQAAGAGEDSYDFQPMMSGVEDWIGGADLALCGMEVPLAPEGMEPIGYPVFAAPDALAGDLEEVGFDGCSTASNHSMDSGLAGLTHTLDVFDEQGLGHVGTARSEEEASRPQMYTLERGGREVTVAHLSTTRIHNRARPLPEESSWAVTDVAPEQLTAQARRAREAGADVVVASVHWGQEYTHAPTEAQRTYGEALAAGGEIDVVLGSHSHTPQPTEVLAGGPDGEGMRTIWSMGNFLSNQDEECCVDQAATGAMAIASVEVPAEGEPQVTDLEWAPVTVDRGPHDEGSHRGIWPLDELISAGIPSSLKLDEATLQRRREEIVEVMGQQAHRTEPPEPTGAEPVVEPRGE